MSDTFEKEIRELGFETLETLDTWTMNRPDDNDNELKPYGLVPVGYRRYGMGWYSVIGKREGDDPSYYYLVLGGSSGIDCIINYSTAFHYTHTQQGLTVEEMLSSMSKDEFKDSWGSNRSIESDDIYDIINKKNINLNVCPVCGFDPKKMESQE